MLKAYGVGIVAKDIELKYIGQEKSVALATTTIVFKRNFKNKNGDWQEEDTFIICRAWSRLAERLSNNVKKGNLIAIEGTLVQDNWTTQDGKRRSSFHIRIDRFTLGVKTNKKTNDEQQPTTISQENNEPPVDIPF